MLPKNFNYFDYINTHIKYQVHHDQYCTSTSCALLHLSSHNPCKSSHEEKKELMTKKLIVKRLF